MPKPSLERELRGFKHFLKKTRGAKTRELIPGKQTEI